MKNIKKMLVLMLVTSFTFLASCSKDDNSEDNIAFGDIKVSVDGDDFEVSNTNIYIYEGGLRKDVDETGSYMDAHISNTNATINVDISNLTEAKSYITEGYQTSISFYQRSLDVVKSKTSTGTFSTRNHNKTSTIEVLEYDKANKRIKVKFNATLANSEGETKNINIIFYKAFSDGSNVY